jgi:hypothetical protein
MAFDIGIFGGGRRQQQQQDESPFALLGEMMQMQQFGIQMQERRTLNEQRQEQIDKLRREEEDYDAMRLTVQKYTPQGDDQEADFDSAVHELYQTGRAGAAMTLQNKLLDIRKQQAEALEAKVKGFQAKLALGSRSLQGVTDEASYARVRPMIAKLIPDVKDMLPAQYGDGSEIKQLVSLGLSNQEYLQGQLQTFNMAKEKAEEVRKIRKDNDDHAKQVMDLSRVFTEVGSGFLSLARNQQEWDAGITMVTGFMTGQADPEVQQTILSQFGTQYSDAAKEKARLLPLSQAERSAEKDRKVGRSLEQQRINNENAEDTALGQMSDDAINKIVDQIAAGDQMPAWGMGKNATAIRIKIYNRLAEKYPTLDMAQQRAIYTTERANLQRQTTQLSAIRSYKDTALKNLEVFEQAAGKVIDTGSPWINGPLRAVMKDKLGSADQAVYDAARAVVMPELARIIQNPNLTGVLSNQARKEIDEILEGKANFRQIKRVIGMLKIDMNNRTGSMEKEIEATRKLLARPPAGAVPDTAPAGGNPQSIRMRTPGANGREISVPIDKVQEAISRGATIIY